MYKQLSKSFIFLFLALLVFLCFGSFVYAVDGVPEFLLTANDQHTIDVRLSRGDGTFAPPVSVGDDLGVNYGEFAIADFTGDGQLDFIASTNEDPADLYLFTRTGPASFEQTFLFGLDEDPKAAPDYGYGLIAADLDNDGDMDFLENINHDFGGNKYWIAKGNAYLNDGCGNFTKVPNAFNFAQVNVKVLSDNTWKSYDTLQTGWETPGFDDSGWRNAYAPYPNKDHPTAWIPDTEAIFMWDYPDHPPTVPYGTDGPDEAWFRKTFTLDCYPSNVVSASVVVGADDDFDFYVNGVLVHSDWDGTAWSAPFTIDIKPYLVKGENVFAMYAKDSYGIYEWALVDVTIEWKVYTGWTLGISSTVVDVNGDGYPDMLASEQSSGVAVSSKVYLLKGNGDGTFQQPVHVFTTADHPATHMTLGDFNNDGKVDAIVGQDDDGDPGAAFLFLGCGDGTFEQTGIEAFDTRDDIESGSDQPGGGKFQAYDADHDGILDIISAAALCGPVASQPLDAKLLVFHGRGDGTFDDPQVIAPNILTVTAFQVPVVMPIFSITATVEGSQTPEVKDPPCAMVINEDFTITPGDFDPGCTLPLGDGVNEGTNWRFDFTKDPELQCFPTSLPLASALLTLKLTPKDYLIYNDIFRIDGLSPIPAFIGLPIDVLSTIQIELANFYRNMSLTHLLKAMNGSIPAFYADDAIVSFAELTLTSFPGEKVNDRFPDLGPEDVDTDFDATPCAKNCIGTFTITAEFKNTSSDTLSDLFFEVGDLTGGNVLCNADGGVPWGYGADLTVPMDGVLKPGDTFVVEFKIGLRSMKPFIFEVDLFGKVQK